VEQVGQVGQVEKVGKVGQVEQVGQVGHAAQVGRCYWRKNHRLVLLYPGKYDWEGNPAQGDCSLRIKVAAPSPPP
jgi:hypothetical protein